MTSTVFENQPRDMTRTFGTALHSLYAVLDPESRRYMLADLDSLLQHLRTCQNCGAPSSEAAS